MPFPSPMNACMLSRFSRVRLCGTLWTAAHQAPLTTRFSRQEYWSGLPFPNKQFHYPMFGRYNMKVKVLVTQSCPTLVIPWTIAHPAPPSLGFSRQEHWSGLPFPSLMHESESEVAQSCPTLSDPMDCSPPGSSVHGIFQARVLEWGAIAFSLGEHNHVQFI